MSKKVEVEVEEVVSKILDLSWDNLEVAEEQTETKPSPMDSLVIDWIPDLIEEVIVNWHRPRIERWYIMPGLGPLAEQMHQEIRQEIERRSLRQSQDIILRNLTAAYGLTPADLEVMTAEGYISGFDPGTSDFTRMLEVARDAEVINTNRGDARTAVQALVDSVTGSFDTFFKACSTLFEIRVLCVWDEFVWKMKRKMKREIEREIHLTDHPLGYAWRSSVKAEFNDLRARGQRAAIERSFPSGTLNLGTLTDEEVEMFRTQWVNTFCAQSVAFCTPSRFGLTGRQ